MTATEAAAALVAAVSALDGFTVTHAPGKALASFPAVVIPLPQLTFSNYNSSLPTEAEFSVYVIAKADGYALAALETAVSEVINAIWAVPNAVVAQALPGTFTTGNTDLPCYVLTAEVSL